jgi:hypothetical protein
MARARSRRSDCGFAGLIRLHVAPDVGRFGIADCPCLGTGPDSGPPAGSPPLRSRPSEACCSTAPMPTSSASQPKYLMCARALGVMSGLREDTGRNPLPFALGGSCLTMPEVAARITGAARGCGFGHQRAHFPIRSTVENQYSSESPIRTKNITAICLIGLGRQRDGFSGARVASPTTTEDTMSPRHSPSAVLVLPLDVWAITGASEVLKTT